MISPTHILIYKKDQYGTRWMAGPAPEYVNLIHNNTQTILDLSNSILLMIPPSLTFFIVLAFCLRYKLDFIYSLLISILSTGGVYWVYILILYRIGIRL